MYDIIEVTAENGFKYKGKWFVFYQKKLYQLPYSYNRRYYKQREVIFKDDHYRLCRDKVGIPKIKFLLQNVSFKLTFCKESETPF
tara:strand:- start:1208 stop:1462 length:255 start_codon:yes stop_codon:yes gene_type:complete